MRKRRHTLKSVKALRESQRSWDGIEELLGLSRATYYRWEKAGKGKGLAGPKIAPSGLAQVEALTVTLGPGEVGKPCKVRASPVATAVDLCSR